MAWTYGWAGFCTHLVMVNSSWTQSHIEKLWKIPQRTKRVYPPCNTLSLQALPLERPDKDQNFISVAQFRPEKAHGIQLEAFAIALRRINMEIPDHSDMSVMPKLQLVGSCRNEEDKDRLLQLKKKCSELGINKQVEFCENVMYKRRQEDKSLQGRKILVKKPYFQKEENSCKGSSNQEEKASHMNITSLGTRITPKGACRSTGRCYCRPSFYDR
eukprot:Gb_03593 [translate_table: standard]